MSAYNGWTNYETWCVHLWLSNEEGSYRTCRGLVRDLVFQMCDNCTGSGEIDDGDGEGVTRCPDCKGEGEVKLKDMGQAAEAIKDWIDEYMGEDVRHGTMASDLVNAALSEANWQEIAEAFAEE